jgi:hypothetical protein
MTNIYENADEHTDTKINILQKGHKYIVKFILKRGAYFWKINWLHTVLLHTFWNQPIKIKLQDKPSIIPCTQSVISVYYQLFKKIFNVTFRKVKKNKNKTNNKKISDRCPINPGKKKI